ncbi:MAG: winged helix-turn-helix domain-containing protein [Magnetospirillum sp.]|nr:winged helix-turn-helix domain-containing protein [Magnetospirillum sp.]
MTRLLADIEAGEFKPGQPLGECALAARYGVSRTPVREALMQLAATGVVERVLNKGCRVRRNE